VTAGVIVRAKVYIAIMRPATDAGRADVVFDLAKMMADDGTVDHSFSFACLARAHLLAGPGTDVARHGVGFHHRIPFYESSKRFSRLWQAVFVRVVHLYTLSTSLLLRLV
jgi:hypothetical protein